MATATIQLTDICTGGNHLTFTLTTGARAKTRVLVIDEIQDAITDQDIDTTIATIAKLVRQGRTLAQARTILQTGVSVGQ